MNPATLEPPPHKGWVTAPQDHGPFLTSIGIKLGRFDTADGTFKECEADVAALSRLDAHAARYVWLFEDPTTKRKKNITDDQGVPLALGLNGLAKAWLDVRPIKMRSHGFHPSEMAKFCPVLHVETEQQRAKLASDNPREVQEAFLFLRSILEAKKKDFSSGLEFEFMVGDAVHDAVKFVLGGIGKLWGRWKCPECHNETPVAGWMPRIDRGEELRDAAPCVHCNGRNLGHDASWLYVEPALPKDNPWGFLGHLDGDLRVKRGDKEHRYVLEVKSAATINFNRGDLPMPHHLYQASIYGWVLGVTHICFIYVLKDQARDWKEIIVPVSMSAVADAQNKIRAVLWGRQTGQLPTFARACPAIEEQRARDCPAVRKCFGCAPPPNLWDMGKRKK